MPSVYLVARDSTISTRASRDSRRAGLQRDVIRARTAIQPHYVFVSLQHDRRYSTRGVLPSIHEMSFSSEKCINVSLFLVVFQ